MSAGRSATRSERRRALLDELDRQRRIRAAVSPRRARRVRRQLVQRLTRLLV